MNLEKVTKIDQIKKGDTLIITGDIYKVEPFKAEIVKVSENDGTEIIINKKENKFFNLGMYLKGKSWVKEVVKIES